MSTLFAQTYLAENLRILQYSIFFKGGQRFGWAFLILLRLIYPVNFCFVSQICFGKLLKIDLKTNHISFALDVYKSVLEKNVPESNFFQVL